MKIDTIHFFDYRIPLKQKLYVKKEILTDREGIIIQLITDQGDSAFSEVSPLPGLHQETLPDVRDYLLNLKSVLAGTEINSIQAFYTLFDRNEKQPPTVRVAIESALLIALLQSGLDVLSEQFSVRHLTAIPVNALIGGISAKDLDHIEMAVSHGFRSIKLKVGRHDLDQEIRFIREAAGLMKNQATFRLDANRAWELPTAIDFISAISDISIEYIEEPLKNPHYLPLLYEKTGIPLALDESLSEKTPDQLASAQWLSALVIKPTVLGALSSTFDWLQLARQHQLKAVISDTFQSGVGLSFLIRLAAATGRHLPMGFDTYQWLSEDVLEQPLTIKKESFILEDVLARAAQLNFSKLQEIIR